MWPRLLFLTAILVLIVVALFSSDLVHSDPGIPIEDFPIITGFMALISFGVLQPKRWVCRETGPSIAFICLTLGLWLWVRDQYRRADTARLDQVSLVFPGLYFPRDSLRYTFTALVGTKLPEEQARREILRKLNECGVPVTAQRVHFLSTPASPNKTLQPAPGR